MAIITINILADAARARRELGAFGGDIDRFASDAERHGGRLGRVMSGMGTAIVTAGAAGVAAAGAFAVDGLKQFKDFQQGMNEVFTLLPNISATAMDEMSDKVKNFSRDFKVLPETVIPSLYEALSSGVPEGNVFAFLEVAQKAARGGVTELATTVDGLTTVINSYGAENLTAQRASDVMFQTVKFGKATFDELAGQMYDLAPVAAAMGVSFEEVGAGMAVLTSKGVPARVATTQIRSAIVELSKEAGPTSAFAKFKEISGKTFPEFVKAGGTMGGAMKLMADKAKETNTPLLNMFASVEAGQAFVSLASDGMEGYNGMLGEMQNAAGSTQAAFERMDTGLGPIWDDVKTRAKLFRIELGEKLAPAVEAVYKWMKDKLPAAFDFLKAKWEAIRPTVLEWAAIVRDRVLVEWDKFRAFLVDTLIPGLQTTKDWLTENKDLVEKLGAAVAAIFLAWKTAEGGITLVRAAIIGVTVAQGIFNAVTEANPWVLLGVGIALAIGAVVGAIFWLVTQTDIGRQAWNTAWESMSATASTVWNEVLKPIADWFVDKWVNNVWPALMGALNAFKDAWPAIKTGVLDAYNLAIKPMIEFIAGNAEMFKNLGIALGVLAAVFVALGIGVAVAGVAVVGIIAAITILGAIIVGVLFVTLMRLINIWWDVFNNLKDVASALYSKFTTIVESVVGFVQAVFRVASGMWNFLSDQLNNAAFWIGNRVTEIVGFFTGLPARIDSAAAGMWNGIKDGFRDAVNSIIRMWNDLSLTLPGVDVPGFGRLGGFTLDTPNIPYMAAGGIVTKPTFLLAGEAGPEAIIPLGKLGVAGGAPVYNITVSTSGLGADNPTVARDVVAAIRSYERRNGPLYVSATAAASAGGGGGGGAPSQLGHASDLGDGINATFVVPHMLGTSDVLVEVYEIHTGITVPVDPVRLDADNVEITFTEAPAYGSMRCTVLPAGALV